MAPTQPLIVITWICSQNPECVNRVETSWPKDSSPMGQPQGLPLQFVLAVLKRGTLGAPHPRLAPKVTQGPMSIGRGTLQAGDSGSDHTSKMGLLPIPPVTRRSAGMPCWGGIGRRGCLRFRVKRRIDSRRGGDGVEWQLRLWTIQKHGEHGAKQTGRSGNHDAWQEKGPYWSSMMKR